MGSRGSEYKAKRIYGRTENGYVSGGRAGSSQTAGRESDDFSRKGIGDKLNVDKQRHRGRKTTGESQYRKYKENKRKKRK